MILLKFTFRKFLSSVVLLGSLATPAIAQDEASQLGFSSLQANANALVEGGKILEAMPLLKELVKRVEASGTSEIPLDFPIFLIGTAHIQQYVNNGQQGELEAALAWYDKLESDFPRSPRMRDMLLKRIDVLRVLGRNEEAIALMKKILGGGYREVTFSNTQQIEILKDLVQIYYNSGQLEEGLPSFGQLLNAARHSEDQALAAAASFEGLFQANRIDDALKLLSILARESEVRYRPRLNVALLRASDDLVNAGRVNDAALTLNLVKTTDVMIQFHVDQIALKKSQLEQRAGFGNTGQIAERLQQEIKMLEANLEHLRGLPTLRNELLVRRARNYTNTERRYEAFWMFYDLMLENPDGEEAEFYLYATFSNALQVNKRETAIEVGRIYRSKFPNGDYFSDVNAALAVELKNQGNFAEFVALAVDFLSSRPRDPVSGSLFAQWAAYLVEQQRYVELITQAAEWNDTLSNFAFEDGIFYWSGIAELQMGRFQDAVGRFEGLLSKFPGSVYAEDSLLRKGVSLFYAQRYEEARSTLYGFADRYPVAGALDQAYFFLGEIEYLAGDPARALEHFRKADQLTDLQDVHDGTAFRIGALLGELGRYEEMAEHFQNYMVRFADEGDITRAALQLGVAFESLMRPVDMLALYREKIELYANELSNPGVDALIESYAQKYAENRTRLERTVAFFDRLESDLQFRRKIVTDRGFLFEYFYENPELDQSLYNRLRRDPKFTAALLDDLQPINHLITPYRVQLRSFPEETPEAYFRAQLAEAKRGNDIAAETRMLMGLYRIGVEVAPSQPFDGDLIDRLTPLVILYVADYERNKRLDFAIEAWNLLLNKYPTDDGTIVAYMRLADVSAEREQRSQAVNYLDQIVERFPGSPKVPAVILRQGELLTQMGRSADAREKYQYILRVPEWRGVLHARALYQTGQSYMAEGAHAEAHGFYERTFLGYPHLSEWSARAYLADANALLAMGATEDAIRTLNEATQELTGAPESVMEAINTKLETLNQ